MASNKAPVQQSRSEAIKTWQAAVHVESETTGSSGIVGTLFDGIMMFLKLMLENMQKRKPKPVCYRLLENSSAALFFWGRDFGVPQGELDTVLQHSSRLRDTVLTVLISLGEFMGQGLICILSTHKEREGLLKTSNIIALTETARSVLDEPPESVECTTQNIEELCSTLQTKIESLNLLSPSLECPAEDYSDDEETREWVDLQDRSAHMYFADFIIARFPLAEKRLVEILGQSNWDRYKYVQKQREHAQDELEMPDKFHDSGIGSSAPAQSVLNDDYMHRLHRTQPEYAATVISSRAKISHKRLPPLPERARSGNSFQCEICDRTLKIRRTKKWKEHVFKDLLAYTCIFSGCSFAGGMFEDHEAMKAHLESKHGINHDTPSHACPLCLEEITGGRDLISNHFARHMEEIALSVIPHGSGIEDDFEQSAEDVNEEDYKGGFARDMEESSLAALPQGSKSQDDSRAITKAPESETTDRVLVSTDREKVEAETWPCTFCHRHLAPKSWRRHEDTQHKPRAKWTCLLHGPRIYVPNGSMCAFCVIKNPSEDHFLHHHRISECAKRPPEERTFNRPDHLRQHVKHFHNSTLFEVTRVRWESLITQNEGWTCGFCGTRLDSWDMREIHIPTHFRAGLTMKDWKINPEDKKDIIREACSKRDNDRE